MRARRTRVHGVNATEAFIAAFTLNYVGTTSDDFLHRTNKEGCFHLREGVSPSGDQSSAPD